MSDPIILYLDRRPFDLDHRYTTVVAETRCPVCEDTLSVTQVVPDGEILKGGTRTGFRLQAEVIESLLIALAEHDKENHAVQ